MVLLFGAFVVGSVIHQVFIKETIALTSPVAVFGTLAGVILIGIGRRVENRHKDVRDPDDTEEKNTNTHTFDEEAAPFDETDLEKYERDEQQ